MADDDAFHILVGKGQPVDEQHVAAFARARDEGKTLAELNAELIRLTPPAHVFARQPTKEEERVIAGYLDSLERPPLVCECRSPEPDHAHVLPEDDDHSQSMHEALFCGRTQRLAPATERGGVTELEAQALGWVLLPSGEWLCPFCSGKPEKLMEIFQRSQP